LSCTLIFKTLQTFHIHKQLLNSIGGDLIKEKHAFYTIYLYYILFFPVTVFISCIDYLATFYVKQSCQYFEIEIEGNDRENDGNEK